MSFQDCQLSWTRAELAKVIAEAVAAEREACAKLAEDTAKHLLNHDPDTVAGIAHAIRNRGKQ